MNNQTSSTKIESVKHNARINLLVDKLRKKLSNFALVDKNGHVVGEVKDLILDSDRQLNLVIFQSSSNNRLFLLISKLIQKIDTSNRVVIADVNQMELQELPEYVTTEIVGKEISANTTSVQAMVTTSSEPPADDLGVSNNVETNSTLIPHSEDIVEELEEDSLEADSTSEVLVEEIIRLLGERIVVDTSKRKIGEVIVRKEIETRMVQVPVRREKLIIEQVSPEHKKLAEIDLGQGEIAGIDLTDEVSSGVLTEAATATSLASGDGTLTVSGDFNSPKVASLLLNAIAMERRQGCKKVRVQIVVEDEERQKTYQEWFNRCSTKQQ